MIFLLCCAFWYVEHLTEPRYSRVLPLHLNISLSLLAASLSLSVPVVVPHSHCLGLTLTVGACGCASLSLSRPHSLLSLVWLCLTIHTIAWFRAWAKDKLSNFLNSNGPHEVVPSKLDFCACKRRPLLHTCSLFSRTVSLSYAPAFVSRHPTCKWLYDGRASDCKMAGQSLL